jgi:REP element-mobilizing transposase RayT
MGEMGHHSVVLKAKNYRIAGFVIMPGHVHVMIDFSITEKRINKIIGYGKRFVAYSIVQKPEGKMNRHCLKNSNCRNSYRQQPW